MEIGEFDISNSPPQLEFEFGLDVSDFHQEWIRCSLFSNYIAGYVSYQFYRREWAENLVSTVINDFLEAVLRASPNNSSIKLKFTQYEKNILIEIKHVLNPEMLSEFREFLTSMNQRETEMLYFQLLTNQERAAPSFNQLGLAMLVHDFGVRLAMKTSDKGNEIITRATIPTAELVE